MILCRETSPQPSPLQDAAARDTTKSCRRPPPPQATVARYRHVSSPCNPPTAAATMSLGLSIPQAATTIFPLKSSSRAALRAAAVAQITA
eukprot:CAMPEP_0194327308 /NCGR_PEP_ID=MMETSP0171-20130528/40515_1 /TAXON_ID=218684 /ORGANISM="Corethron pennatum, Strain L29A3" /LENGTH=89 /DNA_ID=CAMNT_0039087217 /DNA_START=209 /DNA_END=479 /DNA_ORIENTATION=-